MARARQGAFLPSGRTVGWPRSREVGSLSFERPRSRYAASRSAARLRFVRSRLTRALPLTHEIWFVPGLWAASSSLNRGLRLWVLEIMAGIFPRFWPVGNGGSGAGCGIHGIFGDRALTAVRRGCGSALRAMVARPGAIVAPSSRQETDRDEGNGGRGRYGPSRIVVRRRSRGHLQRPPYRSLKCNLQTHEQLATKKEILGACQPPHAQRGVVIPSLQRAASRGRGRVRRARAAAEETLAIQARNSVVAPLARLRLPWRILALTCPPGPQRGPGGKRVPAAAPRLPCLHWGATRSATVGSLGGRNPLSGLGI